MNPVPWFLRALGGWRRIKASVNAQAKGMGLPTYSESPTLYRLHSWGTVGFPPRVACNVTYCPGDPIREVDLGRHSA